MTVFEKTDRFLRNLYETAFYFAVMAVKENFRNYVGRAGTVGAPKPSVLILGNGPSLAEDLPRLIARGEHTAKDIMAVNYFALDERFTTVRPAYYVLSDPMFFRDSVCRDRVAELYRTLAEKVTWPMNLYVQYYNPERFDYRVALPNPNIRIVRFHTQVYRGFRGVEFWLYRHGLGSANFGTVVQVCEYVALLLGYKTLELYGVDHTLLDGLSVDDENPSLPGRQALLRRHSGRSEADLPEGSAPSLYDGRLSGRGRRTVPRPRGAARLRPIARGADHKPDRGVDDRRLRAGTKIEKGRF